MAQNLPASHCFAQALTKSVDLKTSLELAPLQDRLKSQSKWMLQIARSHLTEEERPAAGLSVEEVLGLRGQWPYAMTLLSKPVRVYFKRRNIKYSPYRLVLRVTGPALSASFHIVPHYAVPPYGVLEASKTGE